MGYETTFNDYFDITPPLTPERCAYLRAFSETRRMRRDPAKTATRPDPLREAVGLPVGPEGAYFVGESGWAGQDIGLDVTDHNLPPEGQPGLWCQWIPDPDGRTIGWDGGEKFYEYEAWIRYLIDHFLAPWGHKLDGKVTWYGEDYDDRGRIIIVDNEVTVQYAVITYA